MIMLARGVMTGGRSGERSKSNYYEWRYFRSWAWCGDWPLFQSETQYWSFREQKPLGKVNSYVDYNVYA